ncbi:rhodanese-like domain-containing protein [Maridesulfovibrio hydrothermalis]|uniref:Rhodanese domain protein n=1 Tax=Maridesulfovibrio hydrothermalis AM13 = DSM 14728 TaxID=1121451 RepID=L0RD06_9BACT|nr:rhodanese-like domain-containing protein [Maridesulfovibrio hydrothermalis]CCO24668.1 Rhodanese domain protein [Maridesulfovibrio hydrothermalis AM13 = DSM 14728]
MKFGKKTAFLAKVFFICALSAVLAVGFNMVRPAPYTFAELSSPEPQGIAEIDTIAMLEAYDSGNVVVVDARSDMDYGMGHVPGSLNIPSWAIGDELEAMAAQIEQGKPIIIYCDGLSCGKSMIVAKKLVEKGFRDVSVYTDGIDGWLSAGRDLEVN